MKKIYLVINDTMRHKQIGNFCKVLQKDTDGTVKIETSDGVFWAKETDLKDITIDYYFAKGTNLLLWLAAIASFAEMVANIYNGGHWIGTVGFAIISFVCFTVYKIQKDEY